MNEAVAQPYRVIGRYALYDEIASGGMATVYFGRLLGPVGFSRTVAIKALHPQYAKDPSFVSMFLDEARVAARVQHPNVVSTIDVVTLEGELFLVMEYVQGESLSRLIKRAGGAYDGGPVPPRIALSIMASALYGLHAAHEARTERGEPLGIVHRDVSPQNIIVGIDGSSRVLDFGVAKAAGRLQTTNDGQLKGKIAYMSPEQILGKPVDRRTDIYAAAVVLWEALTGKRLFEGDNPAAIMNSILEGRFDLPSRHVAGILPAIDHLVLRGLAREPDQRFSTAREMAMALEAAAPVASTREVGDWVMATAGEALEKRSDRLAEIESISSLLPVPQDSTRQASQPETLSTQNTLTTNSFEARVRADRLRLAIATGAAAALGVALVLWLVITVAFGGRGKSEPGGETVPAASVVAAPEPTPSASASAPAVVSAEPAPAPAASSAPPKSTARKTAPPPMTAVPKPPSCASPFWVDDKGIRHPKPECF